VSTCKGSARPVDSYLWAQRKTCASPAPKRHVAGSRVALDGRGHLQPTCCGPPAVAPRQQRVHVHHDQPAAGVHIRGVVEAVHALQQACVTLQVEAVRVSIRKVNHARPRDVASRDAIAKLQPVLRGAKAPLVVPFPRVIFAQRRVRYTLVGGTDGRKRCLIRTCRISRSVRGVCLDSSCLFDSNLISSSGDVDDT